MDVSIQLRERQDAYSRELVVKQAILQVKTRDLERAKASLITCISERDNIKVEEQSIIEELGQLDRDIENAKKCVDEMHSLITLLQKELRGTFVFNFSRKKELKGQLESTEGQHNLEQNRLDKMVSNRSKLERNRKAGLLESMEIRVIEQRNTVISLETEVSEIESDIEEIKGKLSEIESSIQTYVEKSKKAEEDCFAEELKKDEEVCLAEQKKKEVEIAEPIIVENMFDESHVVSENVQIRSEEIQEGISEVGGIVLTEELLHENLSFYRAKNSIETNTKQATSIEENVVENSVDIMADKQHNLDDEKTKVEILSLYRAILLLCSEDECWNFLGELIGPKEYKKLEQRIQIAKLLDCGGTYNMAHQETGASTATISRVNAVLNEDDDFHSMIFKSRHNRDQSPREYFGGLILSIQNEEECKHFFSCLCSPVECHTMELRFSIAEQLYQGKTYERVSAQTGASSATVGRVKRILDNDISMVRTLLKRAESSKDVGNTEDIDNTGDADSTEDADNTEGTDKTEGAEKLEGVDGSEEIVEIVDTIPIDIEINPETKSKNTLLYYKLTDVDALGYEDEKLGFVLKKGSKICVRERITCSAVTRRLRRQYAPNISSSGILEEDIILKSVNEATNFCAFGTAPSTLVWKDESGTPLRTLRKNDDIDDEMCLTEEMRKSEEGRRIEETKRAEEERRVEEVSIAEEALRAEEARIAEKASQVKEERRIEEELTVEESKKDKEVSSLETCFNINNQGSVFDNIAIELLELSVRSYNALKRADISFVGQMMSLSEDDLQAIKNMGRKSISEILNVQNKIRRGEIDFSRAEASDDEIVLNDIGPLKMIEKAKPELIGKKIDEVYFKNRMGMWQSDCLIEDLEFSVRTLNCLKRENYSRISEVAFSEFEQISKIKNMGKVSIEELLNYLKTSVEHSIEKDIDAKKVETVYEQIITLIVKDCPEFEYERYERSIKSYLMKMVVSDDNLVDDMSVLIKEIFSSEIFLSEVEKMIVDRISSGNQVMPIDKLFIGFPSIFKACGLESKVIESLAEKGVIERCQKGYRLRLPCIPEWLEMLEGSKKQAVMLRLEGKTLQEAGDTMGISRERVRQLVNKACKNKPQLREDDYAYWYSKYECDAEAMENIFGADARIYNYLGLFYIKGTEDIEKMFDDPNLNSALYERVHAYVYRNSVLIGSEYVPRKREVLCREVAKQVCSECDVQVQDLYDAYMTMLEKNRIQDDEKLLFPSVRAFEARMQDNMYMLMKYGHRLRYYMIAEHDVTNLIKELDFERFKDIEISTLKLFREYPELMAEFDIRDEYELHNLLKKTESIWNYEGIVSVKRMPYLVFGNANRQRQTEELMYQLAPISLEDFCEAYETEYGVLRSTASANMVPLISNYLHDGVFAVDQPTLTEEEKYYLSSFLKDDFYFTEDVKKIFVSRFGKENADHLNPRTIKEQGYRVYINYLISNQFSSSADYFFNMITKNPVFDISDLDRRIIYVQQFNVSLDSLRNSLDMIEYEDGKYLSYSHFTSVLPEYNKQALTDYITETLEYASGKKFFTIRSLIQDGYDHPLHHIGFGDWFNGALLKNSKRTSFVRTGGTILFYEGTVKMTTVDFLRHVLSNYKSMDIYDLIDLLQDDYGINILKEKIIQLVKESELHYDSTMEKLYLNKEYFYEEL